MGSRRSSTRGEEAFKFGFLLILSVGAPLLFQQSLATTLVMWVSALAVALLVRFLRGLWVAVVMSCVITGGVVFALEFDGAAAARGWLLGWIAAWVLFLNLMALRDDSFPGVDGGYGRPTKRREGETRPTTDPDESD